MSEPRSGNGISSSIVDKSKRILHKFFRKRIYYAQKILWIAFFFASQIPCFAANPVTTDRQRYNKAIDLFETNQLAESAGLFSQLHDSFDDDVAFRSRFNIGNCQYLTAIGNVKNNPTEAITMLQQALNSYHSALRIDRNDQDVRANIELTIRLLEQLQEQQDKENKNKEEQANDSAHNPPEQQNQEQKSESKSQQQSQESDQNQQASDQEKSELGQQSENSTNKQQSDSDNSNQEESIEEQSNQENQGDTQDESSQESSQNQNESSREMTNDSTQGTQQNQQDQKQHESDNAEPMGDPKESDKETPKGDLSTMNPQEVSQQPADIDPQQQPTPPGVMTREEANKMLQAIRDRDMLRRMRKKQFERRRHIPVEKDW